MTISCERLEQLPSPATARVQESLFGIPGINPEYIYMPYKIGRTADSRVFLYNPPDGPPQIIKIPKARIENPERVTTYLMKTYKLLRLALGKIYVPETLVCMGRYLQKGREVYGPIIIQEFIEGCPADQIPQTTETQILWWPLGRALYHYYKIGYGINKQFPPSQRFPLGLTVGPVRQGVLNSLNIEEFFAQFPNIPSTPNIVINPQRITVVDFGPYIPWSPNMEQAYQEMKDAFGNPNLINQHSVPVETYSEETYL